MLSHTSQFSKLYKEIILSALTRRTNEVVLMQASDIIVIFKE